MKKTHFFLAFVLSFSMIACSDGGDPSEGTSGPGGSPGGQNPSGSGTWSIPVSQVVDGGPGKDGIPSIDTPVFVKANEAGAAFLNDDDLVIGVLIGSVARAYPHTILDWHEVVNDEIQNEVFTVSYCPLTGTAFGWDRTINETPTTFGVSGLLYNANLILYDRNTDSNWSQLLQECVNGSLQGSVPQNINIVETNWKTWKTLYPDSDVLSLNTGFSRNYNVYPYGSYKTDNALIFPVAKLDERLHKKERVFAILDKSTSKAYRFSNFSGGKHIRESLHAKNILIVGNETLIKAFELNASQESLEFQYAHTNSDVFFKDHEGNEWSVFGKALTGSRAGEQLTPVNSVVSYWFALSSFYNNIELYTD